jgi:hypothetical protein
MLEVRLLVLHEDEKANWTGDTTMRPFQIPHREEKKTWRKFK